MPSPTLCEADYLVIGTGAVSMSFVDTMLSETSDKSFIMVDRHHMPGGHWNDAYPFVRLHQPSAYYGVNSKALGSDRIDQSGSNKGFYELASGAEVSAYFEQVMRERFLPSGRVQYFPMCNYTGDGAFHSLLSDQTWQATVHEKTVDGTYFETSVPSTHNRPYEVEDGVTCIAPNTLPQMAGKFRHYVVIGGGKTAMDTCVWLLNNGASPEAMTWVVPRASWLINRETTQPGEAFFTRSIGGFAKQLEAMQAASSADDLFERLEASDQMIRIDRDTTPTMFHFATISHGEVDQMRRIKQVIKGRHVARVSPEGLTLSDGEAVATPPETLFVDCTASAVPFRGRPKNIPVFQDHLITLQAVRAPLVTFSAAIIAFVEAHFRGDMDKQNTLCAAIELSDTTDDWPRVFAQNMINQNSWGQEPKLREWLAKSRLDPFSGLIGELAGKSPVHTDILTRIGAAAIPAVLNLQALAEQNG